MKKLLITIAICGSVLAYQPAAPPPVLLSASLDDLHPTHVMAIIPAVVVGAVVVGGVAWAGLRIVNKVLDVWEHQITNAPVDHIAFTLTDEYPE